MYDFYYLINQMPGILVIGFLLILCVWLCAIRRLIDAAKMKGHFVNSDTAELWLIGLFASPIVLGLYTASLPDRNATVAAKAAEPNPADELPAI